MINPHFRSAHPNEDSPTTRIPSRAYAKFDHIEIDADTKTLLLAFDIVDAPWIEQKGQKDPLMDLERPDDVAKAWEQWKKTASQGASNPFEGMLMYRLEIELSDGQSLFGMQPLPPVDDARAIRRAAGDLERSWFELEIQRPGSQLLYLSQGQCVGMIYSGLFTTPAPVIVRGRMPSSRKGKALSKIFSLSNLPTITTRELEYVLSSADADLLAVYDVGQGNANALMSSPFSGSPGLPSLYYDLGAGVYRNKGTTPQPLVFCFTQNPPIILSHWDADHWAGSYAFAVNNAYPALKRTWIAPLQEVGPVHVAFAHDVRKNDGKFFIYSPSTGEIGCAALSSGRRIRFTRGNGNDRNGTGIVLVVEEPNNVPARSWLLTGDCDYLHFVNQLQPLPPVGMVAPHHGADLDKNSPIPKPPAGISYKRLVYSFGPGNKHGNRPVRHPTSLGVMLHNSADWDHRHWCLINPGRTIAGGDVLATCEHTPGLSRGGVLIGWDHPPSSLGALCRGAKCVIPLTQV